MKKKGLIISTVVMVVVLIAALTTTTFAWFSQTSENKVEDITVSVAASSDVKFGVAKNNTYTHGAAFNSFATGSVTYSDGTWTGGTDGLGYELNTNLTLNFTKAVFTGEGTTIDGTWTATHGLLAASTEAGKADTDTPTTAIKAVENNGGSGDADVLHLVLGIQAGKSNLEKISCTIKIDLTHNPIPNLGMNAALAYCYKVDGYALNNVDAKGENKQFFTSGMNATEVSVAEGNGQITFDIASSDIDTETIYQLDLYIYIDGKDADCVTAATGSSCAVQISFSAEEAGA